MLGKKAILRFVAPLLFIGALHCWADAEAKYEVLNPGKSKHLVSSAHFVARWNDEDGVQLSEQELQQGLQKLEEIWDFYLNRVGFPPPYANQSVKYKVNVNLSNKGWASGSGTGLNDPAMWLHFNAFKDRHALAHEFAHSLQFSSMGMRDSPYVGWFWECHAEWMAHQFDPNQVGCSEQLLNASHLYYGSTRDRYGNWQFWEYIKDSLGYGAVNDIWTKAKKPGEPGLAMEDPLVVLARNRGWSTSDLNDQFGLWAMHNVTWDYKNGAVYRKCYGSYDDHALIRRNRVALLEPVDSQKGSYIIPDYRAPQRLGYNLVRIEPDSLSRSVSIHFRGLVQTAPAVAAFQKRFEKEPKSVPPPCSDWRWGLVAVDENGTPRYSPLQRGADSTIRFPLHPNEKELWLVVTATPSEYQRIQWDQMYYTIYRYPWRVEIQGGRPWGSAPDPLIPPKAGSPHPNGGGWVAATAHVDASAFIAPTARVLEKAQVLDDARIEGLAVVSGNAQVREHAVVRGHARVAGTGSVAGQAVLEGEAAVYSGTVDENARLGALTLVTDKRTKIHGKANIAAVMNRLPGVELSGDVQLIGDIELYPSLSQGVFYGMVTPEMAQDRRWGAQRTAPEPEVTAVFSPLKN